METSRTVIGIKGMGQLPDPQNTVFQYGFIPSQNNVFNLDEFLVICDSGQNTERQITKRRWSFVVHVFLHLGLRTDTRSPSLALSARSD